ncbi:MAG: hypothetical protein BWX64_02365 [Acidobacteria bacterium ADurb.Bin051]|nr:MAG: hypothetical protein BWX64_02365 [Acidobacteria bacterium ADurb.Bin051]
MVGLLQIAGVQILRLGDLRDLGPAGELHHVGRRRLRAAAVDRGVGLPGDGRRTDVDRPGGGAHDRRPGTAHRPAPALIEAAHVLADLLGEESRRGGVAIGAVEVAEAEATSGGEGVDVGALDEPDVLRGDERVIAERGLELTELDRGVLEPFVADVGVLDVGRVAREIDDELGRPVVGHPGLEAEPAAAQPEGVAVVVLVAREESAVDLGPAGEAEGGRLVVARPLELALVADRAQRGALELLGLLLGRRAFLLFLREALDRLFEVADPLGVGLGPGDGRGDQHRRER